MHQTIMECPDCHQKYPDSFGFCIDDGNRLVASAQEAQPVISWLDALRAESDRMVRGRLIVLNEAELKDSKSLLTVWAALPETYLRVDLLRFGPPEVLQLLSELGEIYKNSSLYLCFLKRCLNQNIKPAFLESLPKPEFENCLSVYHELRLKWDLTQAFESETLRVISPASVKLQVS